MLQLAIVFLLIALIAAFLGFAKVVAISWGGTLCWQSSWFKRPSSCQDGSSTAAVPPASPRSAA